MRHGGPKLKHRMDDVRVSIIVTVEDQKFIRCLISYKSQTLFIVKYSRINPEAPGRASGVIE